MTTTIHREYIRNPSYKIVIIKKDTTDVWLFDRNEKELVDNFYNKFKANTNNKVKLFERLWKEVL